MPAHINYETTPVIFYKFVCEDPKIQSCYVGHTTNFNRRKTQHKHSCNTEKSSKFNRKIYQTIREHGGFENWKMVEIDRQICLDLSDACKKEQEYIEKLQTNLNTHFASRTQSQYYFDNKEHLCEQQKIYRLKNKEHFSEQSKIYRLNNKEQISEQKKQYWSKNKEHFSEQSKIYRLINAEKISEQKNQQFDCECGKKYTHSNKARHFKTLKHLKYCETIKMPLLVI